MKLANLTACVVCIVSLCGAVLAADPPPGAALDKLPANQWVALYDGPRVSRVMPKLHWLTDQGAALLLPMETRKGGRDTADPAELAMFRPADGAWREITGTLPADYHLNLHAGYSVGRSPTSSVWLPNAKRLLLLQPALTLPKKFATSWLIDPTNGVWEPVSDLAMTHKSVDYNPAKGNDGALVPIWGGLAWDGLNKEAVSCCGSGTWGRVTSQPEKVAPGAWIYDEPAKRVRRLTPDDRAVTQARRWFPANCGTWTFSEAARTWAPIEQPLGQQPTGRMYPAVASDESAGKIVLFGGDDAARCLDDTWLYDCRTRTWSKAAPKSVPPSRAGAAMIYVAGRKLILLAGGYTGGGRPLSDVWVYRTADNTWTRVGIDLPAAAQFCSACYDPASGAVLLLASGFRPKKEIVYALRLEGALPPVAVLPPDTAGKPGEPTPWHMKNYRNPEQRTWLPEEWLAGEFAPEDPKTVQARLEALPANTWKKLDPPRKPAGRQWGVYAYDAATHTAVAWGGGHFGYDGSESNEFSLLTNRWRAMAEPTPFKPMWTWGSSGGPPGVGFGGWSHNGTHTRKSIGVDPVSGLGINIYGDLYSLKHHLFVGNIGRPPGAWGLSDQPAYAVAPQGLYAYSQKGGMFKVDMAAGKWVPVGDKGGPVHDERSNFSYDSKRDRLVYMAVRKPAVWTFDLKTTQWVEEKVEGAFPAKMQGDSVYLADLDAVLLTFPPADGVAGAAEAAPVKAADRMFFYKLADRKWYSAVLVGDGPRTPNADGLSNTLAWDNGLKLVLRITHWNREGSVEVFVMRLDAATLKLMPVE